MPKPRRRVKIELRMGADSWKDAADTLECIATEIRLGKHCNGPIISGGYTTGYAWEADEDESITHDSYQAASHAYIHSDEFRERSEETETP